LLNTISFVYIALRKDSYIVMVKKNKPTESELEVLQILWEKGPSSVRTVNEILNKKREVGYTTTLKIMQIMSEKGLCKRNTESRTHIYIPVIQEDETKSSLVDSFVNSLFKGSKTKLVLQALGNSKATPEELAEIRTLIEKIEKK